MGYTTQKSEVAMVRYDFTHGFGAFLLWFFLFTTFVWVLLFSLRPSFVLNDPAVKNSIDGINYVKLLWTSVLIGLAILLVCWLLSRSMTPMRN